MGINEQYEEKCKNDVYHYVCSKCNTSFEFEKNDTWWDEKGFGYSTQLVCCSECGAINIVKYVEDYGLKKLNMDRRLYFKNK